MELTRPQQTQTPKTLYFRPLTGTGETARRVNSCFNQQLERVRQRVQLHIDKKKATL